MGDDVAECRSCGYALRLADLYLGLFPEGGLPMPPITGDGPGGAD